MPDWDAIIVGGGPAGLAAGLYLGRGNWKTLLIEKETVGGYIMNVEFIENYPGYAEGVVGSQLGMEMKNQARKYGLEIQRGEVVSIQGSPSNKFVNCADGASYTAAAVVLTGGSVNRKLGVPGEDEYYGNGVFSCAFCDGVQYTGLDVLVVGGGDAGVTEALYMANLASKVVIVECMPDLTATAVLCDRVKANDKIEVRCGLRVDAIIGGDMLEGVEYTDVATGETGTIAVNGVLVHVGLDPNTDYLDGTVPLADDRTIIVNDKMETGVPGIFAAGDIRSGSPRQVSTAVGDGATAAMAAQRFLQTLT
ncbi:MAG: FAD-dependent oxidoreductase [Dehalococcoidales bacterium]|nr:FAD-dependent oxidoreductase [Dehalococcoidales bacterium]